jgi:hypothetical protein
MSTSTIDWNALDRLARAGWGPEAGEQGGPAREEVQRILLEIAGGCCAPEAVRHYESDDAYLVVEGEVRPGALLQLTIGGAGRGWVEIVDDGFVVFDCMGFDEMQWAKVERVIASLRAEEREKIAAKIAEDDDDDAGDVPEDDETDDHRCSR